MPCSSCTETRPVPATFETLTIGSVSETSTEYNVYLKNIATGMDALYLIESDNNGLILLDRELDGIKIVPGDWHEIRVTLADATDTTDNEDVTINEVVYTCLLTRFTEVYNPEELRKLKLMGGIVLTV